jgi:nitrogen-specific signal transduction histidine kinase/ActR/RegA family two-component response regulator
MWNAAVRGADGEVEALVGVFTDVTEQRILERRLRQAAKLEAIGQLAGGIAHDFNNVMTAVQGHAELLLEAISEHDPIADDIREIRRNAGRATELTRQLLAFSRRQVLQPRVLELPKVVQGLAPMLMRLLGERIRLETPDGGAPGRVRADPTQLEQVVVNLAVNARDAMPNGGQLRITVEDTTLTEEDTETFEYEVVPGPYVRLRVSDTGGGMDDATQQQVFEPFFTTKPSGQGTGLGLATVYGIVKQSGGYVWVHSDPDVGTEFEILLPRVEEAPTPPALSEDAPAPHAGQIAAGGESVLLVEDDDAVRALTARVLTAHGYVVAAAASPAEVLAWIEKGDLPAPDLLVTDVVLPEMGGQELAQRVAAHYPGLPTLFMSGYTEDEALKQTVASGASAFLPKPFTPRDLIRIVGAVLDGRVNGG